MSVVIQPEYIKNNTNLIFLIGHSCSGKTTLSKKLSQKFNYYLIQIDELIKDLSESHSEGTKIFKLYKPNKYVIEKEILIKKINNLIKIHKHVIIEGTIWDPYMIQKISNNMTYQLICVQPYDKAIYFERIMKRVKSGNSSIIQKNLHQKEIENEDILHKYIKNIVDTRFNEFNEIYELFQDFNLYVVKN